MYFLIGVWGGPRREYAAIKFFLYTLVGSALMLLCILAFYFNVTDSAGRHTFDMLVIMDQTRHSEWLRAGTLFGTSVPIVLWIALFIGFAIKIPAFPFHTWLPTPRRGADAISVILAGILLKMGTYGLLRINYPMLPGATGELAYLFLVRSAPSTSCTAPCAPWRRTTSRSWSRTPASATWAT